LLLFLEKECLSFLCRELLDGWDAEARPTQRLGGLRAMACWSTPYGIAWF
jgi:hypothetical protein